MVIIYTGGVVMYDFTGQRTMTFGDKSLFFYSVDKKEELFKMNFEGIDMFFDTLDKMGKKAFGNAMVLFDGYNDTAKELFEIPQVRKYVKELFKRYPHLLNYINFDLEGHHSLLACLLDIQVAYKGERLTFDQHISRYGIETPLPRHNIYMSIPNELLVELTVAMFHHGNKLGLSNLANKKVMKLHEIFGKRVI
jgi:hypothetical protein